MKSNAFEVNFDGIVGPTHNYSGLSFGNTASEKNRFMISNPLEAALQGLEKMKFLADMGIKQAVLPPQERPFLPVLRLLGFSGSDHAILREVYRKAPELLLAVSSAAYMWTANAATVSPSVDSSDHRLHLTPANLSSKFHRSIEAESTSRLLKTIFKDSHYFTHHDPLPQGSYFADEGAANHARFCRSYGEPGIQLFVFGHYAFHGNLGVQDNKVMQDVDLESLMIVANHSEKVKADPIGSDYTSKDCVNLLSSIAVSRLNYPKLYPARQTQEASLAISRLHALDPKKVVFIQQHPNAIDAGAFHNDVVSVGNKNLFFFHEQAFLSQKKSITELQEKYEKECQDELICLEVKNNEISLYEAISTYLFNSQLVTKQDGSMVLIAPLECQENSNIKAYIDALIKANKTPVNEAHFINLKQSMQNGGGPACLRLRIVMTLEEIAAAHQGIFLTDTLYQKLKKWITLHYRDRLEVSDLADPKLLDETREALDALTRILNLGNLYSFQ